MLETYIDDGVERFLVHDLAAVHLCWMSLQTCSLLRGVDPHNLNLLYFEQDSLLQHITISHCAVLGETLACLMSVENSRCAESDHVQGHQVPTEPSALCHPCV